MTHFSEWQSILTNIGIQENTTDFLVAVKLTSETYDRSQEFCGMFEGLGRGVFTGVPDSLLKSFCAYVTDNCGENHVIAANEGGTVTCWL